MTPLERLDSMDRTKQSAFLGLFAGAQLDAQVAKVGTDGRIIPPKFGKAECEWVDDWHDFYSRELPELGLTTFDETPPRPALGMVAGSTCWTIMIGITADGRAAREAYWDRVNQRSAADVD